MTTLTHMALSVVVLGAVLVSLITIAMALVSWLNMEKRR
jgi:hypothetical protein